MVHPREGGRRVPLGAEPIGRRTFLRRAGLGAASLPLASAILAACGPGGTGAPGAEGLTSEQERIVLQPARPDRPVTLPIADGVEPIPAGMKPEGGPLEIYNWEEYINPRVVKMFEDQYDVKVNVNTFNTVSDGLANITETDAAYDVFFPTIDMIGKLAVLGHIRPLTKKYLPNLANVWPIFTGAEPQAPFYDVGSRFTVPYTVYKTGLAWRIDQPRGVTIAGPAEDEVPSMENPWDILWDTRFRDQAHVLDDFRETPAMVLLRNGITDINTDDASKRDANLGVAARDLGVLRDEMNAQADIQEYIDIPEGKALVHLAWSGDYAYPAYYMPDYQKDTDVIRWWNPPENAVVMNDTMTVMTGGKNPVLAHHFLNFLLDFDQQSGGGNSMVNYQWTGYPPPMAGKDLDQYVRGRGPWVAGRILDPSLANTMTTQEDYENGLYLLELSPEVETQWKDVWEQFRSA